MHPCKFTLHPAVLPWACCFEELLDGGDGDGDGGGDDDDDHGDDVHVHGDDVCGDADQYDGCHEEDGKSDDGGGGCGDGPF